MTVAMMSLDDRVLHVNSSAHGVSQCGETMRDPWVCGPLRIVDDKATSWCEACFADVMEPA